MNHAIYTPLLCGCSWYVLGLHVPALSGNPRLIQKGVWLQRLRVLGQSWMTVPLAFAGC